MIARISLALIAVGAPIVAVGWMAMAGIDVSSPLSWL